jgi:hypothetical protein
VRFIQSKSLLQKYLHVHVQVSLAKHAQNLQRVRVISYL